MLKTLNRIDNNNDTNITVSLHPVDHVTQVRSVECFAAKPSIVEP